MLSWLLSSPLHTQTLQKFGLSHAILQQNDYTSSSFLITLFTSVKFKIIQIGMN